MAKIDELDHLKLQNLVLREQLLKQESAALNKDLLAKYGQPGETGLRIAPDGTIMRPAPLESVPDVDAKGA